MKPLIGESTSDLVKYRPIYSIESLLMWAEVDKDNGERRANSIYNNLESDQKFDLIGIWG